MNTFATTLTIILGLYYLWLFTFMLRNKPRDKRYNNLVGSWKEGGKLLFFFGTYIGIGLSIGITFMILFFNFLEKK